MTRHDPDAAGRTIYPNVYRGKPRSTQIYPSNLIRTTKYRWWNFLPKNLWEQFHRVANIYFVFIVVLNWIPAVNAFGKEVAMIPVIFVLCVTAVKDGYEDYCRYQSDKKINNRKCRILSSSESLWTTITWQHISVGDIVRVVENDVIPADVLLLRSSDSHGTCFIETANLDGENNLKQKECVTELSQQQQFRVEVEPPNADISKFHGCVMLPDERKVTIDTSHILLRGCVLRSTDHVEGLVLYAGHDTKAMLNNHGPRYKRSHLEHAMNRDVIWCVIMLVVLCLICSVGSGFWLSGFHHKELIPYLVFTSKMGLSPAYEAFVVFWTFILVFQVIIPLSLYVSIEIVKMGQVYFIRNDIELYDPISNQPAECNAFNITEDLGKVEYVFADKTGTLTENDMQFHCCSIGGTDYPHNDQTDQDSYIPRETEILSALTDCEISFADSAQKKKTIQEFVLLSAICNTVVVKETVQSEWPGYSSDSDEPRIQNGWRSSCHENPMTGDSHDAEAVELCDKADAKHAVRVSYHAQSPDERALVEMACRYGYTLQHRTQDSVTVSKLGEPVTYKILQIFHFDASRKRMSVIVRCPLSNSIILYCKGADSVILPKLRSVDSVACKSMVDATRDHLDSYASKGLRTLCMARKEISEQEFESCQKLIQMANTSCEREEQTKCAADILETDLQLLGVSGIEDRLQPGVAETIADLQEAGMYVWMLTGDKQETAVSVAYACQLLNAEDQVITLQACSQVALEDSLASVQRDLKFRSIVSDSVAMVINGQTLEFALEKQNVEQFLSVMTCCSSVICCRTTPAQKAAVVKLVQDKMKKLTLAIGDGANDVSMIQTADIGVGISGQEGMQAVMASDFAIARFCFLKRLLLVHGHWSYYRLAVMILYMFYKNSVFVFMLFWYQLFNGYSGTRMMDQFNLIFFNVIYTAVPPVLLGIMDQDLPDSVLLSQPKLYKQEVYPAYKFWLNILDSLYQSLVMYFIPHFVYEGSVLGLWQYGVHYTVICTSVTLLHLLIQVRTWTWPQVAGFLFSVSSMWVWCLTFDSLCVACSGSESTYMVTQHMAGSLVFWLVVVLATVVSLLPRLVSQMYYFCHQQSLTFQMRKSYQSRSDQENMSSSTPLLSDN